MYCYRCRSKNVHFVRVIDKVIRFKRKTHFNFLKEQLIVKTLNSL